MKTRRFFFGLLALPAVSIVTFSGSANAASQTWDGDTNANWTTTGNWVGNAVPGINPTANGTNTTDVATFNSTPTFGGSANPVIIDGTGASSTNRMVGRIVFDTASAGAFVIGASGSPTLQLGNNLTVIDMTSTVVNSQIFNAPIALHLPSSTNGVATVQNNASSSTATLTLAGGIQNATNSTRGTAWTLGGSNTGENTVSGAITIGNTGGISSSLTKTGTGTWVLSGANTIPGGVTINAGVLAANNNTALGSNATANTNAIAVNNGGTLEIRTGITLNNGLSVNLANGGTVRGSGTAATNGRINVGSAASTSVTLSTVNSSDVFTIGNAAGDFVGGTSDTIVNVSGPGTVVQSVSGTAYLGGWSINSGTLRLGSATNGLGLATSAFVNFGASTTGTLQLNGNSNTIIGLNTNVTPGSAVIENGVSGTATLTVNNASANTFAGVMQNGAAGTLAFTKGGSGVLTLSGSNTYDGATSLNAGTLNVTGSLGNTTVTVANGATLAGNGSISGTANLGTSGSHIAPGNAGVGILTLGSLTLGAGSQLDYDITNVSTLDQITVSTSGGLTINGGQLNINGGAGLFTANGVYNLIGYSGAIGGTGTSALSVNGSNQDLATKTYSFNSNGSFVTLTIANATVTASFWNTDSSSNWNNASNWTGSIPNAVGAFAAFGGGGTEITADRTISVDSAFTVGTISLNGAANNKNYTLANGGGSLTLDNGATAASLTNTAGNNSIDTPLVLTTNGTVTTVTQLADTLNLSGIISGTGALTKAGGGSLLLSGNNSFVGNTVINGGTLAINSDSSLGDAANSVTVNLATLRATEDITTSRSITLGDAASAISVDASKTYTIGATVSGSGALSKNGAGTLVLSGSNTFLGGAAINAGTVVVNSATSLGDVSGAVSLGNAMLKSASGTYTDAHNFALSSANSTIQIDSGLYTMSGVVSGSGTLNKTGAGDLTLSNVNTFAGAVLSGGTVRLGSSNAAIGTGTITFQGGTLNSQSAGGSDPGGGGFGFANNFVVASGQSGTLNLAYRGGLSGSLTGAGTFNINVHGIRDDFSGNWSAFTGQINVGTQNGSGDFRINTANGYGTAKVDLAAGVNMSVLLNFGAGGATFNAGEISGAAGSFLGGGPTPGRVATWSVGAANTNATFAGTIRDGGTTGSGTGTTAITKVGTQTWTLTGTNTYSGLTTISAGNLQIGSGGTSGSLGTANVTNNATLAFNRSDAISVGNAIAGSGSIVQLGTGQTTLSATNSVGSLITRFGETVISGSTTATGFVSVGSVSGDSGTLTVQTGGALVATSGAGDINVGDNHGSTGILNLTGGSITSTNLSIGKNFDNVAGTTTGTVNQSGSSTFTVNGANGVILANNTDGVGTYNLNGGTLVTKKISQGTGTSGTFNFNGGTLQAGGANTTFLNGLTAANVQAGGANINDGGFAVTIGQALIHDPALGATADGGLTKTGVGKLTLSGANTYTGATAVNSGTLFVNGSLSTSSAVGVQNAGSTLGGNGTVAGAVTVSSGAILAAGDSATNSGVGVLSIGNGSTSHSLGSGSIFSWDLNGNVDDSGASRGVSGGYDGLDITGTLTVDSAAIFRVVLGTGVTADTFWQTNHTWNNIFGGTGSISGAFDNSLLQVVDSLGAVYDQTVLSSNTGYAFSVSGSTLSWSAVPEPTSALAGLLLGAGLLRRKRSAAR